MEDFTFYKQSTKKLFKELLPSKIAIQNILNYSKAMQVKKTVSFGLLVFINN